MASSEDSPPPYLQIYLGFALLLWVWETYLDLRQLKKNQEKERPEEIKDLVAQDRFEKSQVYQVDKIRFKILSSIIGLIENGIEIVWLWPIIWNYSKTLVGENEYWRSITWQILVSMVGLPISIPMDLYKDFVLEERHGFNKKTLKLFVTDFLQSSALGLVFTVMIVPIVIAVVKWGGDAFYLYMWAIAQILVFVFMFIYPTLIMPLFNKFEPLRDQDLKKRIEDLAGQLNYPLSKLFQMDGSKRSAHSNAYLFGFGNNKRIVLFDTLLQTQANLTLEAGKELGMKMTLDNDKLKLHDLGSTETIVGKWNEVHEGRLDEIKEGTKVAAVKFGEKKEETQVSEEVKQEIDNFIGEACGSKGGSAAFIFERPPYSTDEILAILCHEIGHWYHSHVLRMMVFSSMHIFVLFRLYGFTMSSGPLFQSFGFDKEERSVMIGLSIFMLMFTPVEAVVSMVMTLLVRSNEYQADDFAVKQKRGTELATGLRKLCMENLGDLNPDPLYAWFHHSHPGLVERLRNIREKDAAINKKSE
mmetsp:Transcript_57758/g.137483  ORF Transcript_57758/g.137483 Transcript_57758/m.137483 type:complete len:529 (-) Transcript_57758:113-1699(-)